MRVLKYILPLLVIVITACEEGGLLIETDISNSTVVLLAPANGAEVSSNTLFFDWEALEDATSYEIQVATPNFDQTAQLLYNTEDSLTVAELQLPIGTYEWRVRAKNSNYATQYTTASFSVVAVENFSENTVLLTAPENNLITNVANQVLVWQEVEGATLYRIQILENGSINQEFTATNNSTEFAFDEGDFTWQVRAENGLENTLYFARDIFLDSTSPNTPTLTTPENGIELSSSDVSFEWTREMLEGSVEFDSIYVFRDITLSDLVIKEEVSSSFSSTLTNDTYYWFVKGFDEAGNESNASSTFSFTVNE